MRRVVLDTLYTAHHVLFRNDAIFFDVPRERWTYRRRREKDRATICRRGINWKPRLISGLMRMRFIRRVIFATPNVNTRITRNMGANTDNESDTTRGVDFLDEDPIIARGQKVALLSVVRPMDSNEHKFAVKFRGGFESVDDANAFVEKLNSKIPAHKQTTMMLVEAGKWLCFPPPTEEEITNAGGEEVYGEEYLQRMFKQYTENRQKADDLFKQRKEIVQTESLESDPYPLPMNTDPMPMTQSFFTDRGECSTSVTASDAISLSESNVTKTG